MAAKALTTDEAKKAKISLIEGDRGSQAVHDVVVALRANRRSGSANTKTRGEVAATGKKPFRQKGTGRARQGGNASPIHRGGGVAFGPRPRDYSKKVNKATRRLAFSRALTERINDGDVLTVDSFAVADGKTKSFAATVEKLSDEGKLLILGSDFDEATKRAGRNYKSALLMSASDVNTEHLLKYKKIIVVGDAIEALAARTSA